MAVVTIDETGGLGALELELPPGRLSITPASRICLEAIGRSRDLLRGAGIDWGSGSGCLAITAARIPSISRIVGIEISGAHVAVANGNAARNNVSDRVVFVEGDSFEPVADVDRALVDSLVGRCEFLIANPPASSGDDGLGWRRSVLDGARRFFVPGSRVLLQVSYQYSERIQQLALDVPGYEYEGILASTDWSTFDLARPDLAEVLRDYAAEEATGGIPYTFSDNAGGHVTATDALKTASEFGTSPLSKWQMHLFRWNG